MTDLVFIRQDLNEVHAETDLEKKVEKLAAIVSRLLEQLEKQDRNQRHTMGNIASTLR